MDAKKSDWIRKRPNRCEALVAADGVFRKLVYKLITRPWEKNGTSELLSRSASSPFKKKNKLSRGCDPGYARLGICIYVTITRSCF